MSACVPLLALQSLSFQRRFKYQVAMRGCIQLLALGTTLFGALCVAMGAVAWLPFFSDDMRLDLVGVIVFIVGGSLFYLVGSWLEKRVPAEKPKRFVLQPRDTRFIRAMLLRDRRNYLILGVFLLSFDAFMVFVVSQPSDGPPDAHPWVIYFFGGATMLLIAIVGIWIVYAGFRLRDPSKTRLYEILTNTPDKVTYLTVHLYRHEYAPGTVGRQIFAAIEVDGEELRTGATEEQWALLKQYILLHNPHAGYREVEHEVSGGT
jgi:MFS family permease